MATTKQAPVPSIMKAVRIAQYGGSEQLKYEEVPLPEVGAGHVLAKVRYAGVNPGDWKIREGYLKLRPASFPLTLGQDFAGEIVTGGGDSGHFRTGERVFGFGEGTYAEFTVAAITDIVAIPEKMEFAVAAALPTAGLTALQAIRDYVHPRPGTRILIQGAAGSVGSFATQIAKRWGAQVIGTASGEDIVYLRSLGHVEVVDYKHERFESVGQVDAVLDLIGGETAARSFAVVKKGGVLVSPVHAANAEMAAQAGIRAVDVVVKWSAADLAELAGFVERGDVKPRVGEVFRLEQAREAQDASQQGRAKGKILLKVA
jgi:NADPH:quinone reductase-like Zn-dependent oxidoreductase